RARDLHFCRRRVQLIGLPKQHLAKPSRDFWIRDTYHNPRSFALATTLVLALSHAAMEIRALLVSTAADVELGTRTDALIDDLPAILLIIFGFIGVRKLIDAPTDPDSDGSR